MAEVEWATSPSLWAFKFCFKKPVDSSFQETNLAQKGKAARGLTSLPPLLRPLTAAMSPALTRVLLWKVPAVPSSGSCVLVRIFEGKGNSL